MISDKRTDYITWDEYFMGVAKLSALRSKDPHTQVGACIVSDDNKILSMGYNGLPIGCSDDEFPWVREGEPLENKYLYTAHSELIIQSGIKTVVYERDLYPDSDAVIAAKRMLDAAKVRYYMYNKSSRKIDIEL